MSVLTRSGITAPTSYNRWLIPPAALAIHLCIGQVYAFSVFKMPLVEHFNTGEVAVGWIFSVAIAMLGISSAIGGTWVEKVGPRLSMLVSGAFWVIGFFVASIGIATGQLWLVYFGYGFLGGIGLGIGYIAPVSTLIKWFPDRPGLATGLAIMGFGGGALIASPMSNQLMVAFGGGDSPENLVAGVLPTFIVLAVVYAVVIALGAYVVRVPHPDWKPQGWDPASVKSKSMQTTRHVTARKAMSTPQFWLLWVVLFTNVTAGIGILESASPMIQDYFSQITPASAAGYVGLLSLANMGGRFLWSSVSDITGRKFIYIVYLGVGVGLYLLVALIGHGSLILFILATLVILSFYGGGFATMPAYLKDIFGTMQVGAIHGRLLTAWSAAGVAGPLIVNTVLESRRSAGAEGPALYQLSLFIMVGVLAVGFIANALMRPVADKHYASDEEVEQITASHNLKTGKDGGIAVNAGNALHTAAAWVLTGIVTVGLGYGLVQIVLKSLQLFV